jgi:hypothetical protein
VEEEAGHRSHLIAQAGIAVYRPAPMPRRTAPLPFDACASIIVIATSV